MSIRDVKKSRGRPATGKGTPITLRLHTPQLARLDEWIDAQPDPKPTRPEAIRTHLERSLDHCGSRMDEHPRSTVAHPVTGKDRV
jgi:hypothetical protein